MQGKWKTETNACPASRGWVSKQLQHWYFGLDILLIGGCPTHCRTSSSIPSLVVGSTLPSHSNQKCLQILPNAKQGQNPQLSSTHLGIRTSFLLTLNTLSHHIAEIPDPNFHKGCRGRDPASIWGPSPGIFFAAARMASFQSTDPCALQEHLFLKSAPDYG